VAATDVRQGESTTAERDASPSTPGAMSEVTVNGRRGVDDAGDAKHVDSDANSVAAADVRQG